MPLPHPRVRAVSALLAELAVFLTTDLAVMSAAAIGLAALMLKFTSRSRFLSFLRLFGILAVTLCLLWGLLLQAPPGQALGSDRWGGLRYAMLVVLRLFCASAVANATVMLIPSKDLPKALGACGAHGSLLAAIVGAFALVPEAELRTQQVVTARYARGLSSGRTFWGLALHLPVTLRPVLAWTLRSALHRAEMWSQRGLLERLENAGPPLTGSLAGNALWLAPALLWLSFAAAHKLVR